MDELNKLVQSWCGSGSSNSLRELATTVYRQQNWGTTQWFIASVARGWQHDVATKQESDQANVAWHKFAGYYVRDPRS